MFGRCGSRSASQIPRIRLPITAIHDRPGTFLLNKASGSDTTVAVFQPSQPVERCKNLTLCCRMNGLVQQAHRGLQFGYGRPSTDCEETWISPVPEEPRTKAAPYPSSANFFLIKSKIATFSLRTNASSATKTPLERSQLLLRLLSTSITLLLSFQGGTGSSFEY